MTGKSTALKSGESDTQLIRKKIIEAASDLFEKKGLYETSVAEVAEAAGVSTPVTYHYIKRKSDIMLLIMEDFTDQFKDRALPKIEQVSDPKEKLFLAMRDFFCLVEEHRVKVVLVYRESRTLDREGRSRIMAAETAHLHLFEGIIKEGVQAGIFQTPDTDMAAYNIIAAGHTWALKSWHFRKRVSLDEFIDLQYEFILKALGG